ncbi:cation transporter [Zobellella denitrificans]|uniref:Cation transporter n=1 Tax=Zobellella denitrificans TaxID=347534 RepID=A0A291HSP0_9GAMM|nr:ion transporter [Zobellella denitrificans]ATG75190.1 cation transporter [Zobellella denitrificans]
MSNGFAQLQAQFLRLRSNKLFEGFVISVIVLSALVVGAKTYDNVSRFEHILVVLDAAVTLFFLVEIAIRMAAEPRFRDFFKSGWNIFDLVIVLASIIPIDSTDTVLIARLLRVFRALRLVSMIPELRVLLNALVVAIPRMGYVALLMFIIFYIYAAVGSFVFEGVDDFLWGNISLAMLTLFRIATFEDWTDVMYDTMELYPYSWIYYVTFIFLTAFIFLNMMIGIVLEVMQSESEKFKAENGEDPAQEQQALQQELVRMREQLNRVEALLQEQSRKA